MGTNEVVVGGRNALAPDTNQLCAWPVEGKGGCNVSKFQAMGVLLLVSQSMV